MVKIIIITIILFNFTYSYEFFKIKEIKERVNKIYKTFDYKKESSIDNLIYAKFYELYNLNSEAMYHYEKCLSANPRVSEYNFLYLKFLVSIGMKEPLNKEIFK